MGERQLVLFELEDIRCALDIADVESIEDGLSVAPLSSLPEPFVGVASLHGKPLPVIDMRRELGLAAATGERASRVIVVCAAGRRIGLMVDRVSQVARVQQAALRPFPVDLLGKMLPFVPDLVEMAEGLVFLVDPARLISAAQGRVAAADH